MKLITGICFLVLSLISCATVQTDIYYESGGSAVFHELDAIELQLVVQRQEVHTETLGEIRDELTKIRDNPASDPLFQSRSAALAGYAEFLAGRRRQAASLLQEAQAAYGGDEIAAVLASLLERDLETRITMLQSALDASDTAYRLYTELGAAQLAAGQYRHALAAFDTAIPQLPEEYALVFGPMRERAFALRDATTAVRAASEQYLNNDPVSFQGLIVITREESGLLNWYTGGAPWNEAEVFRRIQNDAWIADSDATLNTTANRGDVALFVWHLLSRNRQHELQKYTQRYADRGTTPVPDVAYDSPWFDAVLAVVEEDIMTLPDGRNFHPHAPISGLEFYRIIQRASRIATSYLMRLAV